MGSAARLLAAYPVLARMRRKPTTVRLIVPQWQSPFSNTIRLERRGAHLWAHLFCGHLVAFHYWTPAQVFRNTVCPAHRSTGAPMYAAPIN